VRYTQSTPLYSGVLNLMLFSLTRISKIYRAFILHVCTKCLKNRIMFDQLMAFFVKFKMAAGVAPAAMLDLCFPTYCPLFDLSA